MLFAMDAEYATDETEVRPNADLACIPPVSGG
jgi:molybdopterin converting factor small subunit